jgi:hypothetical protein
MQLSRRDKSLLDSFRLPAQTEPMLTSAPPKLISRLGLLLVAALLLAAPCAEAQVHLPQLRQVVMLPAETARALQAALGPEASSHELLSPAEELLLSALPEDFHASCGAMIEHWGEIARDSAEWKARALHGEADRVWLAFRCGSRAPEYKNDYDERLALLRLDAGKLEFFPLAPDADNDPTLYHLDFAGNVPLQGAQAIAFKVAEPAENPCCGGPESRSGERWMVLAETASGVAELLSLVTARDDASHCDDPEVDTETTYRAEVKLERDSSDRIIAVTSTFQEETKEFSGEKPEPQTVSRRTGTLRYRWNPTRFEFEETK